MQLSLVSLPKNPLELPEIRTRVASFLDRKDCLSCICVSRDWFHDFVGSVWHTINFSHDKKFLKVTSDALDKYGRFISNVVNIKTIENIQALQHGNVDIIKSMEISLLDNWLFREMLSDLIRRCQGSIRSLEIHSNPPNPNTLEEQRKCRVMVLNHKPSVPLFTGSKLRYLYASFAQVWSHDTDDSSAPCLLSVTFPAQNLAMSTVLGLIAHQETLTAIRIIGRVQDPSLMQWFYFLPRLCLNLEVLSIEQLVLDMDAVEKHRWSCEKLKELRARFEGLDMPQDIDGCLRNVCVRRHTSDTPLTVPGTSMETISSRVTHHLLQFRKLKTVWLGTKVHYLPCMNN
ncbi:hypothetical protein BGX29_006906 [Mortierella sp. GBA35]|nr:hypothetical protein BGX29_006906 [Mortierella sp. GBA35]